MLTWEGCLGSRAYPADLSDSADAAHPIPGVMLDSTWPVAYSCPSSPLVRLTNDPASVKAQIDAMTASGETFIQSGLIWGWRVLSHNAPFADGASSGTKKVLVLMTDGANTMSPTYPAHDGNDTTLANSLTAQTCTNIKAAGIEIYAIAFDVTDQSITTLLGQCASGPPYYYSAATVSDLTAAFAQIGKSLTSVRMAN